MILFRNYLQAMSTLVRKSIPPKWVRSLKTFAHGGDGLRRQRSTWMLLRTMTYDKLRKNDKHNRHEKLWR